MLKFLKFHSLKAVTYQISASLMLSTKFGGESFLVVNLKNFLETKFNVKREIF